jgi:16S rRNA (guanine527-N7)-methyltransferase
VSEEGNSVGLRLNDLLSEAGLEKIDPALTAQFELYFSLLLRWNKHLNLTAIRDEERILSRHFVESISCAHALPERIATLLDFGSGAGFPGLPIALCRSDIAVTLAESQSKKSAFLLEAVRVLGIEAKVHAGRAEELQLQFDCVTLRAVDKMDEAVKTATGLVCPGGWLALMITDSQAETLKTIAGTEFCWAESIRMAGGGERLLALGERRIAGMDSWPA